MGPAQVLSLRFRPYIATRGLSAPFKVKRGVRQGCHFSGMLYSLAVEPLLQKLSSFYSYRVIFILKRFFLVLLFQSVAQSLNCLLMQMI